jgi:acid phosphatase family membrane protein YuiD
VEPGNIFRRKAGTKMEELNKLIEDLESKAIETWSRDKDGNLVKVKMY